LPKNTSCFRHRTAGLCPALDLEHIWAKEVLGSLRQAGPVQGNRHDVIDAVIQEVDRAVTTTLLGKNLKTILLRQGLPDANSD
jgi:hypothetical protein